MSGLWRERGRTVKPPKVEGYAIGTRKGGLYMVPKNKKGKLMWDMARYIGPAPEKSLAPVESTVEIDKNPEEELYSELAENDFANLDESR
jgi:hypothetical protein